MTGQARGRHRGRRTVDGFATLTCCFALRGRRGRRIAPIETCRACTPQRETKKDSFPERVQILAVVANPPAPPAPGSRKRVLTGGNAGASTTCPCLTPLAPRGAFLDAVLTPATPDRKVLR